MKSFIVRFSIGCFGLMMLLSATSVSATLTVTHTPLPQATYQPGSSVPFRSTVVSDTASASYHVEATLFNSSGTKILSTFFYGKVISNTTPTKIALDYAVPATLAAGAYTFRLAVYSSDWSKTPTLVQTPVRLQMDFGTVATKFTIAHTSLASADVSKGQTLNFISAIRSDKPSATYTILSQVVDTFGSVISQKYIMGQAVGNTSDKVLSVPHTLTTTMPIGIYVYRLTILSWDLTKNFSATQNPIRFNVGTYQPDLTDLNLPVTVIPLKPAAKANPLNGTGFLPNTTEDYVLVMHDEFAGTQLDTTKWWTRYVNNGGTLNFFNDECQRYGENNNHMVSGGVLRLVARPRAGTSCHAGGYTMWDSGMIRSKKLIKYGYLEVRVRMPKGIGIWPAFWIVPEREVWPPEIDIFEYVYNGGPERGNMIHTNVVHQSAAQARSVLYLDPNFSTQWTFWTAPDSTTDFNDDFHVISVLWNTDDTVTTYIDGIPIVQYHYYWKHNDGTDAGLAHVLLNLAMGGNWGTDNWISTMTTLEQQLEIDYVRIYQRWNAINNGTSVKGMDLCPVGGGC